MTEKVRRKKLEYYIYLKNTILKFWHHFTYNQNVHFVQNTIENILNLDNLFELVSHELPCVINSLETCRCERNFCFPAIEKCNYLSPLLLKYILQGKIYLKFFISVKSCHCYNVRNNVQDLIFTENIFFFFLFPLFFPMGLLIF